MKNFQQIQFILNEDNRNLMATREIPHDQEQEKHYNKLRRVFTMFAYASDPARVYFEYIQ